MLENFRDNTSKTNMRIMQERLEKERDLFLTKENELEQAEKNPLS